MTLNRLTALLVVTWLAFAAATVIVCYAYLPRPHPEPVILPTSGVAGCTPKSVRVVTVPAGVTTAFSCPTHIEVTSFGPRTPTTLAIRAGH